MANNELKDEKLNDVAGGGGASGSWSEKDEAKFEIGETVYFKKSGKWVEGVIIKRGWYSVPCTWAYTIKTASGEEYINEKHLYRIPC